MLSLLESVVRNVGENELVRVGALNGIAAMGTIDYWRFIHEAYEAMGDELYLSKARHGALAEACRRLSPDIRARSCAP